MESDEPPVTIHGVLPGTAAVLVVGEGQVVVIAEMDEGAGMIVKAIAGLNPGPGRFILVSIETWERTVRGALQAAALTSADRRH